MVQTLKPVQKNRLHEEIIIQIQKNIFKGDYLEGEKLPPERILAEHLNVNRATVREALKKLEILGLIDIRHGDGIYVKDYLKSANLDLIKDLIYGKDEINITVMNNLLEVRRILVPEIASIAATRRSNEDLAHIHTIISNQSLPVQDRDVELHAAIARASKNLLYIFMHNFFTEVFIDFGYLYFNIDKNRKISEKFHRQIYTAIKEKKADDARRIMKDVLLFAEEQTLHAIKTTKNTK